MHATHVFGALLVALVGCAETKTAQLDGPPAPTTPRSPSQAKPSARPVTVAKPSWPSTVDELAQKALPETAREELKRSPVPVLVVNEPKLLASAVVTTGPHWVAVSSQDGGLTVALHGTRLAHDYPEIPAARGKRYVRGHAAFTTENEGVASASWVEEGVAYSLDLECRERDDARCQGDAFLLSLADKLRYVGGEGSSR